MSTVLAELSGDRIWLKSKPYHAELIKTLPGSRWDQKNRLWWLPVSWAACVILRGTFGEDLEIGPTLNGWAADELATRITPCIELRDAEDAELPAEIIPELPKAGDIVNGEVVEEDWDLEPKQRAGIRFMATAGMAANTDGMGSGKTIQTILALELLAHEGKDPYPALIVAPNSMKHTWAKEFELWAPGRTVAIVEGSAGKRRKQIERLATDADVAIINWESLRTHTRTAGYGMLKLSDKEREEKDLNFVPIRTFVADEAHRAKNPKAIQTRSAWYLSWRAKHRFALTGTPLANTPADTWSIMHMLAPDEWPSKTKFIDRFALLSWAVAGMDVVGLRGDHKDEFFKILDPRFIRRPTQVVVPSLLPKLPPQVREVVLPQKQRRAYDQLRKDLLAELDSGILMATNPLTRMLRLVQLAAAYGIVDEHGNLKLTEPSAKLDALDDVLEELGTDEPVVVFAESRQLIELAAARAAKASIPHGMVIGGQEPAVRQKHIDDFQGGRLRILFLTLGAGGEGLTLTRARFSVFLQRSFSMVKNAQAEDRTWRKGQMRQCQRIDIVAADTIEERVHEVGEDKLERLEEICRDEETMRKWLTG